MLVVRRMDGFILVELERFIVTALGSGAWSGLLRKVELGDRVYDPGSSYPAHELREIVVAASRSTGVAVDRILFDFGRFAAPDLVRNYRHLLEPNWRTLDLIENANDLLSRFAGQSEPDGFGLEVERIERAVTIIYRSPLALCAMGRGIIVGLADHYGENVSVREPSCSLKGARECSIQVRESRSTEQQLPSL